MSEFFPDPLETDTCRSCKFSVNFSSCGEPMLLECRYGPPYKDYAWPLVEPCAYCHQWAPKEPEE